MENLRKEWNQVSLIKVFEVEVFNQKTNEQDFILFNISIQGDQFIAQHEALTKEHENSNKIAFVSWDLDPDFSLDENLQTLHELCLNAIIESTYFNLI